MRKQRTEINLEALRYRYHNSEKEGKSRLLDDLEDLYGYNRKYLLQHFNGLTGKKYIKRGGKKKYEAKILLPALSNIWLAANQMCSKKLKAIIPLWLPFYDDAFGKLEKSIKEQLLQISPATIDRLLKPIKAKHTRHGLTGTRPGYLLKNQIPIKTNHWDATQPGFMEADTVAHCGNAIDGNYAWSITLTDICTCWTEIRATWNKGAKGVIEQIKNIENSLPFAILGFDCDNGSEFLNWHLIRYFTEKRENAVQFTRSRPYRKNDNAHVEQKNWTHVRHLFGYDRFDNQCLVALMNDLYSNEWSLYQNHFIPTLKLISKKKMNSKYLRKYEQPKTPYQRVSESSYVSEEIKQELRNKHAELNPFELKKIIELKLRHIFKYVSRNSSPRTKI